MLGASRGYGVAGANDRNKWSVSISKSNQRDEHPFKTVGGSKHEPGQDDGAWEGGNTHRR